MLDFVEINKNNTNNVAIVLHGFGASEEDLLPLADALGEQYRWIVPRAPIPLQEYGHAWFPKNQEQLNAILGMSDFPDFATVDLPDVFDAGNMVCELIKHLAPENFILVGYSQGGMVAVETALQMRPKAMCVFSSAIIAEERWNQSLSKLSGLPVFQSHGLQDMVIPYDRAEYLHQFLAQHCNVHFQGFDGGHELPAELLEQTRSWLAING